MTTEDIYEASEAGDPIMWSRVQVQRACDHHEADGNFWLDENISDETERVDAALVIAWLGY